LDAFLNDNKGRWLVTKAVVIDYGLARSSYLVTYNTPRPLPGDFSATAIAPHPPLVEMTMRVGGLPQNKVISCWMLALVR